MIWWILFLLMITAPIIGCTLGYIVSRLDRSFDLFLLVPFGFMGFLISVFLTMPVLGTWSTHASDISKVVAQEHRIQVQEERIKSLTNRIDTFRFPEKPGISFDADTPWATIVESLTDAENQLASAKDERARAIRSIEARKRGPMSGVVTFVGDWK